MANVIVTHADEPIGRRIVKTLYHDPRVAVILALGDGPPPRSFDRFLAGRKPRVTYARVDLAKHRPVSDLFRSGPFRAAEIDTLIYVPRHGAAPSQTTQLIGGLMERTAESRLVLQQCLEISSIQNLVAIGSAFVYRLVPGNANRLNEESELDLDPEVTPEIRSWIDSDMIFHGEIHNERLRIVLLRVPTVVAAGGYVYLNPTLGGRAGSRVRALGFDPICALVSDKDVARAVQAAIQARASGIFNIAANEVLPLSVLARWTGRVNIPVPAPMLGWVAAVARATGTDSRGAENSQQLRFGFTLDTSRAVAELGFSARYRIGMARAGDGALRLETASV
jgi:UDP-glucose 4-epimerase